MKGLPFEYLNVGQFPTTSLLKTLNLIPELCGCSFKRFMLSMFQTDLDAGKDENESDIELPEGVFEEIDTSDGMSVFLNVSWTICVAMMYNYFCICVLDMHEIFYDSLLS